MVPPSFLTIKNVQSIKLHVTNGVAIGIIRKDYLHLDKSNTAFIIEYIEYLKKSTNGGGVSKGVFGSKKEPYYEDEDIHFNIDKVPLSKHEEVFYKKYNWQLKKEAAELLKLKTHE
jgi:hypothetical protein